jgi:NTP pyrophosphatase (non-canonical NTP hydrolase)
MAIGSEAGELVAELRWVAGQAADKFVKDPVHRTKVEGEVADIAISVLLFCDRVGFDLIDAINRKIDRNAENYPVVSSRGNPERP